MLRMMVLLFALLVDVTAQAQDPCLRPDSYNMLYCAGKKTQEQTAERQRREREERQRRERDPARPPQPGATPTIVPFGPTPMQEHEARVALRHAVLKDDLAAAVKHLPLGAPALLSADDRGVTLLMVVAWRGHAALVPRLDPFAARPTTADIHGNHPHMYAAAAGRLDVIKALNGKFVLAGCNAEGWSPLAMAASRRDYRVVQALLSQGAGPNGCIDKGVPPLVAAAASGDSNSVGLLLRAGADAELAGRFGYTAQQVLSQPAAAAQVVQAAAAAVDRMRAEVDRAVWDRARQPRPEDARPAASFPVPVVSPAARDAILKEFATVQAEKGLIEAVRGGRVEAVRRALDAGAEARLRNPMGETPLVLAARLPTADILKLLLLQRAGHVPLAAERELVSEAIEAAALENRLETLQVLLGLPRFGDSQARLTALLGRVAKADSAAETARVLLASGARPDPWLAQVLREAGPAMLRAFLAGGADLKVSLSNPGDPRRYGVPEKGFTPLMLVSWRGDQPEMARLLVEAGADVQAVTSLRRSALWYAAAQAGRATVMLLLEAGARVDLRDVDGLAPLDRALLREDVPGADIVQGLIRAGAQALAKSTVNPGGPYGAANEETGVTTLMRASGGRDRPRMVRVLVDAGVDLNARTSRGRSALWQAAASGNRGAAKVLLEVGAQVDLRDDQGETPLAQVLKRGEAPGESRYAETAQVLIDAGADVFAKRNDGMALPISPHQPRLLAILERARALRLGKAPADETLAPQAARVAAATPSPPPARSQWLKVAMSPEGASYFVDRASLVREGRIARLWELTNMPSPQPLPGGLAYLSRKSQWEFDCAGRRARILQQHGYLASAGEGALVASETDVKTWRSVGPGMVVETLMKEAC